MENRKKVAFYTLGCKLNFSETSTIARSFQDEGFDVEPSGQGELDIGDFHFGAGESAFQGPSGHRGEMAGGVDHKSAEQKKKDGGKEDTPAQPPAETAGWRRGLIGW